MNDYKYFSNRDCRYYPCHKDADPDSFNCLFCYCPLYALGDECGGSFSYTEKGIKDCSACLLPHQKGGYGYVTASFSKIADMIKENKKI